VVVLKVEGEIQATPGKVSESKEKGLRLTEQISLNKKGIRPRRRKGGETEPQK